MTIGLITCGALAHEVGQIVAQERWDAEVIALPAYLHNTPASITPEIEKRVGSDLNRYHQLIIVYGDCGTRGALKPLLNHPKISQVTGPHCYEIYAGSRFQEAMDEEPGTYFLTDYLVRAFNGSVVKGMGMDRFPDLRSTYFRNYQRVLFFTQTNTPELIEKAKEISIYLGLPLEIEFTGLEGLKNRIQPLILAPIR